VLCLESMKQGSPKRRSGEHEEDKMKTYHNLRNLDFEGIRITAATGPALARIAGIAATTEAGSPIIVTPLAGITWKRAVVEIATLKAQADSVIISWQMVLAAPQLSVLVAVRSGGSIVWYDSYRIWLSECVVWLVPAVHNAGPVFKMTGAGIQLGEPPFDRRTDWLTGLSNARNAMLRELLVVISEDPIDDLLETI